MYFIITNADQFKSYTFPNSVVWEEMIASLEGEIIELFQNDKLESRHFEEYFDFNYRKKKQYGKTDSYNRDKSQIR